MAELETPKPAGLDLQILPAAPPEPLSLREFGDSKALRKSVYKNALEAIQDTRPIVGKTHTLTLSNPSYIDPETFTKKEQKAAILEGRTLGRRVKGRWDLLDNATGEVVDSRHQVVGRVPFVSDLGTITHNGSHYAVKHQQRLKPGIYVRKKDNGELEGHINGLSGNGLTHHYEFDPATGIFKAKVAQAHIPLYPILKSQGLTDKDFVAAWGEDLYKRNAVKDDPAAVRKFAAKVLPAKDIPEDQHELHRKLGEYFDQFKLDPGVNGRNLGHPHDRLSPHAMLAATKKLVALSRGEAESDDRDAPANMRLYGPEDLFAERLRKDHSGTRRNAAWKVFNRKSLDAMPSGLLTKQMEQVLIGSGLAVNLEEVNPSELLDRQTSVTRMGEGGISGDAIPASSRNVQPGYTGLIDLVKTPESSNAGVDVHFGLNARKGSDGNLYGKFTNHKTGEDEWLRPEDLHDKVLAYPGVTDPRNFPFPRVPVFVGGKTVYRKPSEVDYSQSHFTTNFSPLSNLVPLFQSAYAQRMGMGSRMTSQALALQDAEAPLMQTAMHDNPNRSYEEHYGEKMGALRSDKSGIVREVTPDGIRVRHDDGTETHHELFNQFPLNRKSFLHQTPVVDLHQQVSPGQLLARSNYTDGNGATALGKNLRAAYTVWKGMNHEDAQVFSESAAKKMTSEHAYQFDHEPTEHHFTGGKGDFIPLFPSKFTKEHLDALDEHGVIRPGEKVEDGQPLILSARRSIDSANRILKKKQPGVLDDSVLWESRDGGEVTDVVRTDKGIKVVVKSLSPMREGDKASARFGDKGIIRTLPDHEMPVDKDGKPFEVLLNPLGVVSRVNANQKAELWLSKIAKKTGKPYKLLNFDPDRPDNMKFVRDELAKHGVEPTEDIFDPATGQKIPDVATGHRFIMKLHHMSADKLSGRASGGYSSDGEPAKGGPAGCFVGTTQVKIAGGSAMLGEIYRWRYPLRVDSVDGDGRIYDWFHYSVPPTSAVEVVLENGGTLAVTVGHAFVLADGSHVEAGQLKPGDDLLEAA